MREAVVGGALLASGLAGLVYEVCWIRQASLVFGSTTFAVSTVVSVFFLGLAAGSETFGRLASRLRRPLLAFAALEVGVGALALASPTAFGWADAAYGRLYPALEGDLAGLTAARAALVAAVLLPPTFLMGGTLPLACRQLVAREGRIAAPVGLLYGINTAGAAAGCLAAGFWLIPELGVRGSIVAGAALNLAAALAVVGLRLERPAPATRRAAAPRGGAQRAAVYALFFLAGAAALGSEVLWTRFLSLVVRNTVYTYALALAVVLAGIVIGSAGAAWLGDRLGRRAAVFGALQGGAALATLALMLAPPALWRSLGDGPAAYLALMLPPAALAGAAFPIAVRLVVRDPELAARGVGRLLAVNTLGGIAGSLAVGFFGLPALGLFASLLAVTGLGVAGAGVAFLYLDGGARLRGRAAATAACAGVWLLVPLAADTRLPADYLGDRDRLVDFREGLGANLAVLRGEGVLRLEIDRWWQGQDRRNHQVVAAHVPMLFRADSGSVLVIGLGTGQTAARFLFHGVERIDCVDLEPAVFDLVREHFAGRWLDHPRVNAVLEDGRSYVAHAPARYDLISVEVGQLFRPGVGAFYTAEFYRAARARLEPGGIVAQFVPLPFLGAEELRGVVGTFIDAFPHAALWYNTSELLLIGSPDELALRPARIEALQSNLHVRRDLEFSYWGGREHWLNRAPVLLAGFLAGPAGLARLAEGAARYGDDRPELDYATAGADRARGREIPLVDLLRDHLEPVAEVFGLELDAAARAEIERVREINLRDVIATARLRSGEARAAQGDLDAALDELVKAERANPESAVAQRVLGEALVLRGHPEASLEYFRAALAVRPGDARSHRGIGFALHRIGRPAEAIPHYRTALSLDPGDAEVHNNLGAALARDGAWEEAIRHFESAVRLRPDYRDAAGNLARARAASE